MFKQLLLFLQYNKNIECIIDKDGFPVCKTFETNYPHINHNVPSYEPYIPRVKSVFYTCTTIECKPYRLVSMSQLSHPSSSLRNCFLETPQIYVCETVKYQYYKNIDKLLFLANNIPTKIFYLADCLVYSDAERVCHRKTEVNSHAKLVYTGTLARPNENNILSQNELICEETDIKSVYCEYNFNVPYSFGLKQKESVKKADKLLLKTGSTLVPLKYKCKKKWCGYYSENQFSSRRSIMARKHYDPPGGSVFRCYYAKKQQVCKKIYGRYQQVYNERDWLST